jgi:hypothetical protein
MTRRPVPLIAVLLVLAAGCAPAGGAGAGSPAAPASGSPAAPASGSSTPGPAANASTSVPAASSESSGYRVIYPWGVPSTLVPVSHSVRVPPLRFLTEMRFGDHPGEDPPYTRVTFAFRDGLPTYRFGYVRAVEGEATGDPVAVPGNAVLRVTFLDATTTDGDGHATDRPREGQGYPTVRGYGFAGDFEGHVTFGLGIQVAPGSDQALPIRVSESVRPDGTHVVSVDVRR